MNKRKLRWDVLWKKENIGLQHLLFWMLILFIIVAFKEYPQHFTTLEIICFLIQTIALIAIPGYIHNSFILPFFKKKKFVLGILLYAVQLLLLYFVLPFITRGIAYGFILLFKIKEWVRWENEDIGFNTFMFTAMASVINIAREQIVISRQQKEAELRQLKEQLNPHFLFNTLNNLYGLSVLKSDKLPHLMLMLSDLLRYSIYETTQGTVPLQKELLYIKNYVALEKIRLEERTDIDVKVEGDAEALRIAPMLLIVFVENCFKHHAAPRNSKAFIAIHIKINEGLLEMSTKNSLDFSGKKEDTRAGGLGLTNVKKRLALIYSDKYSLHIEQERDWHAIQLTINLNE